MRRFRNIEILRGIAAGAVAVLLVAGAAIAAQGGFRGDSRQADVSASSGAASVGLEDASEAPEATESPEAAETPEAGDEGTAEPSESPEPAETAEPSESETGDQGDHSGDPDGHAASSPEASDTEGQGGGHDGDGHG